MKKNFSFLKKCFCLKKKVKYGIKIDLSLGEYFHATFL